VIPPKGRGISWKRVLLGVGVAVTLAVLLAPTVVRKAGHWYLRSKLDVDVVAVHWERIRLGAPRPEDRASSRDGQAIMRLVKVLRSAEGGTPHRCMRRSELRLETAFGSLTLDLLPGHDPAYYEFRALSWVFRVDRAALSGALEGVGARDAVHDHLLETASPR
jgi:hypothetical protein